jgi:hypothetical protein
VSGVLSGLNGLTSCWTLRITNWRIAHETIRAQLLVIVGKDPITGKPKQVSRVYTCDLLIAQDLYIRPLRCREGGSSVPATKERRDRAD